MYHQAKHRIFLISTEDPDVVIEHKDIVSYEGICGGILVLHRADGTQYRYDKHKWEMYDLTLSKGWNNNAVDDSQAHDNITRTISNAHPCTADSGEVQIAVSLVLERRSEDRLWDESLYVTFSKDSYKSPGADWWKNSEFILDQIRTAAHVWAQRKGQEPVADWGTFLCQLPIEAIGVSISSERNPALPISGSVAIHSDRDAVIAYHGLTN